MAQNIVMHLDALGLGIFLFFSQKNNSHAKDWNLVMGCQLHHVEVVTWWFAGMSLIC